MTAKSPVVDKATLRFEPAAGVIPTAPVEMSDGVEIDVVKVGPACMAKVLPVPVCAATEVVFPALVIGPVRFALVITVAAKLPVPDPVTPPVKVIVWSPVFDPDTEGDAPRTSVLAASPS